MTICITQSAVFTEEPKICKNFLLDLRDTFVLLNNRTFRTLPDFLDGVVYDNSLEHLKALS